MEYWAKTYKELHPLTPGQYQMLEHASGGVLPFTNPRRASGELGIVPSFPICNKSIEIAHLLSISTYRPPSYPCSQLTEPPSFYCEIDHYDHLHCRL
uniref:Uncharacterized protein n=1 Tax=Aquilaria malaccensis TaxID=223753 RepID=A0A4Y6GNI9_9ROSI|nr:hypothetical protein [Aquilaria malaccensis]